ncbi:hypothetical protein [Curtobacterium sp. RRHDQ10]|uniref:hypothetical protein n=1 Tax=Curtobacterium phyllosphaerae TaxID=3413379 RepID=UPI003BF11F96
MEVSTAFLGCYAVLEVVVRNAMHDRLVACFGRDDWWAVAQLRVNEAARVQESLRHLDRRMGAGGWSAGHVVAELPASFWEGLLANRYHASLWVPALENAFPNFIGRRSDLKGRLERLRMLRNRAAHHEPIHARDLMVDHRYACELAGYVSSELRAWSASLSRLPEVVANRSATLDGRRAPRF